MAGEAPMSRLEEVDEGLIHAWLDGELTGAEAARVELLVATDPAWSAAVAEARGLIAASSRIVGALDAVPAGVLPAGSKAAPTRALRVRPWMRMAAGLLLVAGTAYAVRELTAPPTAQTIATAEPQEAPRNTPTPAPSIPASPVPPPPTVDDATDSRLGPTRSAPAASGAGAATETSPVTPAQPSPLAAIAPPPTTSAQTPAPTPANVGELADAQKASAVSAAEREAAALRESTQQRTTAETDRALSAAQRARLERAPSAAVPRAAIADPSRDLAASGAAGFSSTSTLRALEGCWRATAPDSLAALYRDLAILRERGDTLVLVLPSAVTVTVVRREDELRGALTARRVSCPPESSTIPRDSH
jgi:hypothetical protein